VWLKVLSRVDVSYAYPMLSIGYVVAALAGRMFFGEPVDLIRWAGIVTIGIGVWLITRTA
jgi:multidrug transporter EmrE-like cation transporter